MQTTPKSIDIDRLKQALRIDELAKMLGLEIKGKQARCFNGARHKNNDKNFSLGFDLKANRFKCFACGVSGSIIDLYKEVKGVDISQTIKDLAQMAGLQFPMSMNDNKNKIKVAKDTYHRLGKVGSLNWGKRGGKIPHIQHERRDRTRQSEGIYEALREYCGEVDGESLNYLTGATRGLTQATIKRFKIFNIKDYQTTNKYLQGKFTPEQLKEAGLVSDEGNLIFYKHKIIIPFIEGGHIVFLQGRRTDDDHPRYMHLKSPTPLFNTDTLIGGLNPSKQGGKIYICEGVFDAMMLEQQGYKAVAILGVNNFKPEMTGLFSGLNVVLCLDNDESGKQATQALSKLFLLNGQIIKTKILPDGIKDITEYFIK